MTSQVEIGMFTSGYKFCANKHDLLLKVMNLLCGIKSGICHFVKYQIPPLNPWGYLTLSLRGPALDFTI